MRISQKYISVDILFLMQFPLVSVRCEKYPFELSFFFFPFLALSLPSPIFFFFPCFQDRIFFQLRIVLYILFRTIDHFFSPNILLMIALTHLFWLLQELRTKYILKIELALQKVMFMATNSLQKNALQITNSKD